MMAVVERQLGAGDRTDAERLRRLRELHRAVEAVVVGQRKRRVPLLSGGRGQLDRMRRSIEERVGRMAVELDVGQGERMFAQRPSELIHSDDDSQPIGAATKPRVERHEPTLEHIRERHILGVVGLRPSELVGDAPRLGS